MLLDTLITPFVLIAYLITKTKERRLGYKIDFKNLSNNWLPAKVIHEMDSVWKREGLNAIGTNYFTIASVRTRLSERFNPKSPYFQAWLGGYIVKLSKKRKWAIRDHFKLAEADQRYWLKIYGDKKPKVHTDYSHIEELGTVVISGFKGNLFRGNIFSDIDVGGGKIKLYDRLQISGLAIYFKKSNRKLNLRSQDLIPNWTKDSLLESYKNVSLRGYIAILEIDSLTKVVLYANAANFKDKSGREHNNFAKLDKELLRLINNVDISRL